MESAKRFPEFLKESFNFQSMTFSELQDTLVTSLGWTFGHSNISDTGVKSIDPRITHACDHECPHCWANLYGKHMSLNTFSATLDLAEVSRIEKIQFTGGEPTLNRDMIEMAKMAKNRDFKIILRTHGRMMPRIFDSETGETWAKAVAKHFNEIIVSVDGTAAANFQMRPVKRNQKLMLKVGEVIYAKTMKDVADNQFSETMGGYEALSNAVSDNPNVVLKLNTVVARANATNIGEFGSYLSEKVQDGLRIDCWDITQVFPSPESSPQEQEKYIISDQQFLKAVVDCSFTSENIVKRAKPQTSARCLVVDESGRLYFGGEENIELGIVGKTEGDELELKIAEYDRKEDLKGQRTQRYLTYSP